MRHVIRACYPSYRSRMLRKVVHRDRRAERMIEKKYPLGHIAKKTGIGIEWLEITKKIYDEDAKNGTGEE